MRANELGSSSRVTGEYGGQHDAELRSAAHHVVFDVSDLVAHFENNRLPTGIQRVQIAVALSVLAATPRDCAVLIACTRVEPSDFWIQLDTGRFEHVCRLSLIGGDTDDADWRKARRDLANEIGRAPLVSFPRGAFLINLGTSWALPNYLLSIRLAKARYAIRYVPFVYDCTPILAAEHCIEGLAQQFIAWLLGAFELADHLLVISRATAADVAAVAARLGREPPVPAVVTLDAMFGEAVADAALQSGQVLVRHGLEPGGYVLFVGTVESRKNHLLALSAWLSLLKRFGARRVPKLVCVGKRGWLSDPVYAKLQASSALRQHVLMLSGISDVDLQKLYRGCLFTIYPSAYEGWGLPVTESLCFGKVPLLSRGSSLPEAGGDFAEYFDLDSEAEFVRNLERLIFDAEYRAAKERKIAAEFRPRTWSDIGGQLLDLVRGWAAAAAPGVPTWRRWTERGLWPVEAVVGRYYPVRQNRETEIWPGIAMGEIFRQGDGWWWPESWGCWTKYQPARLALVARLHRGSGAVLFLGIRGLPKFDCTASVSVEGVGTREVQLRPDEDKWLIFRADNQAVDRLRDGDYAGLEILLSCDRGVDFRELTNGADTRIASLGVVGFMLCDEGDFAAQLRFIGSAALGDIEGLIARPEAAELLSGAAAPPQQPNTSRKRRRAAADRTTLHPESVEQIIRLGLPLD